MNAAERLLRRAQLKEHLVGLKIWRKETFLEWYNLGQDRIALFEKMKELDMAITVSNLELQLLEEPCQNSTNSQQNLPKSTMS